MDARTRPRRFLTTDEIADELRVPVGDVEALLESGELAGIRVGSPAVWRIEATTFEAFVEAKLEESRRAALFAGFDFGSVVDVDPARRPRPPVD